MQVCHTFRERPPCSSLLTTDISVHDDSYRFHVQPPESATETRCAADETSPAGALADVSRTACEDASVSFQLRFAAGDGGTVLEVWGPRGHYGRFEMPQSWFKWVTAAEVGSQELYVGPSKFSVGAV